MPKRQSFLAEAAVKHFSPLQALEIVLAGAGQKVSRIHCNRERLDIIDGYRKGGLLGASLGGHKVTFDNKPGSRRNWSHCSSSCVPLTSPLGYFEVFLAKEDATAEQTRLAHEERDEDAQGQLFGYPPCCVSAYLARTHSGEFIPGNVNGIHHVEWTGNYLGQFFGTGYYSHLPCGFACRASRWLIADRAVYVSEASSTLHQLLMAAHRDIYVGGLDWLVRVNETESRYESVGSLPIELRDLPPLDGRSDRRELATQLRAIFQDAAVICPA